MKKIFCCAAMALFSYCPVAFASNPIVSANRQVSLGFGVNDLRYTETTDNGAIGDTETGSQFAQQLRLSTQTDFGAAKNIYFSAQYSHASGSTHYDGHYRFSDAPLTGTTDVEFDDLSLKVGKGFLLNSGATQLTPYAQYLYRRWKRQLSITQQENYKHDALGVGIMAQHAMGNRLVLTGDLSWATMFDASMHATESYDSYSYNLGKKSIWGLGLGADYAFSKHIHANVGYHLSYFDYGRSNNIDIGGGRYLYEPDSHTTQRTLMVGVGYAF